MQFTKDKLLCIGYLLIGLILIIGSNEQRLAKANMLSKSVYYPLISNVRRIQELFELRERSRVMAVKMAEQLIRNNHLETKLASYRSLTTMSQLNGTESVENSGFIVSAVVAYRGSFTNRTLIIDKGAKDGIEPSFPVLTEDGIVGKIISVYPGHSVVLPITSPHFKLGVITKTGAVQGLLEADITGNIYMTMIPSGSYLAVGDSVMTSSVSTVFPRGFPVGTISRLLKTADDVFLRAALKPCVEVNNLEQVIVLFYRKELPEMEL